MAIRPSYDLLEALRLTLQKLEQGVHAVEDARVMAELKRMLVLRIAELEAQSSIEMASIETAESPAQPGLSQLRPVTEPEVVSRPDVMDSTLA